MSTGSRSKGQQDKKTVVDRPDERGPNLNDEDPTALVAGAPDNAFFTDIRTQLDDQERDRNVLLNIPIWGWTGDGKTCALVTAMHYCDPPQHVLGLALVTDSDELTNLEAAVEQYRGLNLASTAAATKNRLANLSRILIDDNTWPPGTDEATNYILAVQSLTGTRGYAIFPDLKGGSFREYDQIAREVLKRAHACIVLVNPETYASQTTEGKRYRNEIASRLHKCAEANIPTCVLITRADHHGRMASAADTTQNFLNIQLSNLQKSPQGFDARIFRVSVIGELRQEEISVPQQLPPASDRKPDQLIRAFVWILHKALSRAPESIREMVPPVHLRSIEEPNAKIAIKRIPELRSAGDFSECPGELLCASSDDARTAAFTFLNDANELHELALNRDGNNVEKRQRIGTLTDRDESLDAGIQGHYVAGEFLIGPRRNASALWHGPKGDRLIRVPLPTEIVSWAPLGQRQIVGIDSAGRLHALSLEGGKWAQPDYIEDFIAPTPLLVCGVLQPARHVFALNGSKVEAVIILPNGMFGDRLSTTFAAQYDSDSGIFNTAGLFATINASGELVASSSDKIHKLGAVHPDASQAFAIAPAARVLAVVAPNLCLTVSVFQTEKVRTTSVAYSPALPSVPVSMAWTPEGSILAATYADETWATFRPHGLSIE